MECEKRYGISCHAEIAEGANLNFLNQENQLQVFRIVQEALNNIGKHAEANKAIVILRSNPKGDIFIGVSDDGKGFDSTSGYNFPGYHAGAALPHLGIRSMEKRAALLGGRFNIKSEVGEGTMVRLELPKKK